MQKEIISWETVTSFFNPVTYRQVGLAMAIPFSAILLIFFWHSLQRGNLKDFFLVTGIIAAIIIAIIGLSVLIILLFYGGKYAVGYSIDDKGITQYTPENYAELIKNANKLAIFSGILLNDNLLFTAGMISPTNHYAFVPWGKIKKVRYYPKKHTILLSVGSINPLALFCEEENYHEVGEIISKFKGTDF